MKREMKKTLILMTALLLFGSVQQADAQKRKTTTRRTTTTHKTTVRRTTTLQKPAAPVQKFIKAVAFYDVKAKSGCIAVDKDYLYYVENSNNNAVIGIDRKTGELKTIINGIANRITKMGNNSCCSRISDRIFSISYSLLS